MAELSQNSKFTSWTLSEEEFVQASILTPLQKMKFRNRICELATQKNEVPINHKDILETLKAHLYFEAAIRELEFILSESEAAASGQTIMEKPPEATFDFRSTL